jgi:hypothetical protein
MTFIVNILMQILALHILRTYSTMTILTLCLKSPYLSDHKVISMACSYEIIKSVTSYIGSELLAE